jgi:hypothetical protein
MYNVFIYMIIVAGCFMVAAGIFFDKWQESKRQIKAMRKQIKLLIDELPQN